MQGSTLIKGAVVAFALTALVGCVTTGGPEDDPRSAGTPPVQEQATAAETVSEATTATDWIGEATALPTNAGPLLALCKQRYPSAEIRPGELSGVYRGQWRDMDDDTMDHTLVVLRTGDGRATVLYAHGRWPKWGINRANCSRHGATIENNVLTVRFAGNRTAVYHFPADGDQVSCIYRSPNGVTYGRIAKVKLPV